MYHHGDLPTALLDAVEEIIRERGVGSVSLRAAASRAGVSHAAPAHHFGNKAGLLTAFAALGYRRLAQTVLAEVAATGTHDALKVLEAVGRGYVRFALGHREQFSIMFRMELLDAHDPELVAASEAAYGALVATIEQCMADGLIGDRDPEILAVSAWSLVHGLASLWISGRLSERIGETDPNRLAAHVTRLFVDAVRAEPRPP